MMSSGWQREKYLAILARCFLPGSVPFVAGIAGKKALINEERDFYGKLIDRIRRDGEGFKGVPSAVQELPGKGKKGKILDQWFKTSSFQA